MVYPAVQLLLVIMESMQNMEIFHVLQSSIGRKKSLNNINFLFKDRKNTIYRMILKCVTIFCIVQNDNKYLIFKKKNCFKSLSVVYY